MAKHVPAEVASILAKVNTKNVFVLGDMVDSALEMPAEVAKTLVPAISQAVGDGMLSLHIKEVSDLCALLANGGQVGPSMLLADALFAPNFVEGQEEPTYRDLYWYQAGLKVVVPVLIGRMPKEFLAKMSTWLLALIDAKPYVDRKSGYDHSYMWCPAVEDDKPNRSHDFAQVVTGFLRLGLEQAVRDGGVSLSEAIHAVTDQPYVIFGRLRVHLINEFAEANTDLARQTIMNRTLFDDVQYKHEYAMLVGRRLHLLTSVERSAWMKWVSDGPDMVEYDRSFQEREGREATADERASRREQWRLARLYWVRQQLVESERPSYEALLAKYGEPDLADLNFRITTGWGSMSPMTVADLQKFGFAKAVDEVSSWKPDRRFIGPDVEGLATAFEEYVATDPETFSRDAQLLVGRPAIYVRGFIKRMADAVKGGRDVDVSTVLTLCEWALGRPKEERTVASGGPEVLVDKDWQWTRDQISQFVRTVCEAKDDGVPKFALTGLRERMWRIVSEVSRDRADSYIVHDKSKDDPRTFDYLTLAINSSRGKALEAALEYGRWVASSVKKSDQGREVVPGGFEAMPEVRDLLDWQITSPNRTFESLAIIGLHIGLIYWIDKDWLSLNADRLFWLEGVAESPPAAEGWAAWNAFLVWVRPHFEYYVAFRKQFAYAVAQSSKVAPVGRSREQAVNHLGEHLMMLYGRGQLGLDDDDGLLRRFIREANSDVRRHAIDFVGQTLSGTADVPSDVLDRLKTLWEWYWAVKGKEDAAEKPEGGLFGMWFYSGRFPEQWSLEQLEAVVDVTKTPEPDHAIAEQLARVAPTDPARAVRILDRIIRGDREGWRIHGWLKPARHILETGMKAGGEPRAQSERIIDYLGRRGHASFGELLGPS
jgi:hypothetical protein